MFSNQNATPQHRNKVICEREDENKLYILINNSVIISEYSENSLSHFCNCCAVALLRLSKNWGKIANKQKESSRMLDFLQTGYEDFKHLSKLSNCFLREMRNPILILND